MKALIYKNVIGPICMDRFTEESAACRLADRHALEKKYGKTIELAPLDDTEEKAANDYVYHRFVKEN